MKITIENIINSLDELEYSAKSNGFLQKIDTRVKILSFFFIIVTIVSFNKYEVKNLVPFFFLLSFLTVLSNFSFKKIFLRILILSPFVLFVGVFNPLFDNSTVELYNYKLNGGFLSFLSIVFKFILTIWSAYLLIASSSMNGITQALQQLGAPNVLVNQFYFLHRYIRIFLDDSANIIRARNARMSSNSKLGLKIYATLAATLAVRLFKQAKNIENAMDARLFSGKIPRENKKQKIRTEDILFMVVIMFLSLIFRLAI